MRNLLVGNSLRLNSIKNDDFIAIEEWFNDVDFLRHYDMLPAIPQNSNEVRNNITEFINRKDSVIFAIRKSENDSIIGIIGLFDIQWNNGVATFFIGIGDKKATGKGYGSEAIRILLDYAFNELNLYRIQLNVIEYNVNAVRLYEKAGFMREGIYREMIYRDNRRFDLYLYAILRQEWYKVNEIK